MSFHELRPSWQIVGSILLQLRWLVSACLPLASAVASLPDCRISSSTASFARISLCALGIVCSFLGSLYEQSSATSLARMSRISVYPSWQIAAVAMSRSTSTLAFSVQQSHFVGTSWLQIAGMQHTLLCESLNGLKWCWCLLAVCET